jgi:hypothetical protein
LGQPPRLPPESRGSQKLAKHVWARFYSAVMLRLAFVSLTLLARPALACGFWTLEDLEAKKTVAFNATYVEVKETGERAEYDVPLPADWKRFRDQPARFIVTGMKVRDTAGSRVYTILDGNISDGQKQLGTIVDNTIEVHGKSYALTFIAGKKREWCKLEMKRDDAALGTANTLSLMRSCYSYKLAGRACTDELSLRDVRNRLALYLAWQRPPATEPTPTPAPAPAP